MARSVGWDVTITVRGPVLTTSSAPLEFGIDAPFARNAAGEYYLAGTLVKGRLKEAWRELEDTGLGTWDWKAWIGPEPKEEQDWTSSRGLLQFADFIYTGEIANANAGGAKIIYRIECDDETATVKHGQNQMIQTPFLAAGDYSFKGRIWAITSDEMANGLDRSLLQGLCWVPGIGADTSVGFGVISNIAIERVTAYARGSGWEPAADSEPWTVALAPQGPLCIGGKRIAENIFESEAEIPGGVLKGAIADAILRLHGGKDKDISSLASQEECTMKELCREFSKIRVLHAKAVKKGHSIRPCAIPASVIQVGTPSALKDIAMADPLANQPTPAFTIDWKFEEMAAAEGEFGITHVPHELRVRTGMDTENRRAADDKLFAYRMVVPKVLVRREASEQPSDRNEEIREIVEKPQEHIEGYEWLTGISFAQIGDMQTSGAVRTQLAGLLADIGIPGVGKLKSHCVASRVTTSPSKRRATDAEKRATDRWVITLQTPALLCEVSAVSPGLSDATAAYKAYWEEVSGKTLTLERHFARQTLAGGEFLWKQFSRQSNYRPYVLTSAGAVFVLHAVNGDDIEAAARLLEHWERDGLPIAKAVRGKFGLAGNAGDWKKCPYVPENGYGEIAVDLEWHWKGAEK